MKTFRLILYILGALVLLYLGSQMGNLFKWSESDTYVEKEVILNRVDKVFKLVTVEGHYSELYHSWDAVTSRWLPLYTMFDKRLQKKTILRVNGKVSVGYDMEKLNITFDETNRKVVISSIPQPEILSIEHDLDYYDIDQGSFNKYDADDYNDMNT